MRKAEAAGAAKLVSEGLQGDVLLVMTNTSCSQLHFIYPTFTSATPSLRRMVIERDLPRRTAVMQLSNVYWEYDKTKSIALAVDRAFDVEAVTKKFYDKYLDVFKKVEGLITGFGADTEKKRLFTQQLFNRLMFIAFIQRKGWLKFNAGKETTYLSALWEASQKDKTVTNFYIHRLKLVFAVLNTEHDIGGIPGGPFLQPNIGAVRYVNGGLFDEKEDIEEEKADIVVPDEAVRLILTDLFEPFNFTVMESTPLDQEVAVDPEMLGKVFEALVTGRHESGSYYTPKPVVSFMAREALKGYLQTACPKEAKTAVSAFVDDDKPDGLRDAEAVLTALKRVRVCDPACGSGAYLLGMLHQLLDLRQALFATGRLGSPDVYERKLEIIQNCLYGVDNDPFAVNVARLRLWLSLAVEFDGDSPPPLPNLDFKIELGDSLASPWPEATAKLTFQDELVKRFRDAKGEYLTAHSGPKDTLRKEIDRLRTDIGQWAHGKNKIAGFDWIVEFAEVFKDGGFDIAIANPPYRRQEGLGAEKLQLERLYPQVYASTADYHVYFYNRSVQLLRDSGVLSFITSNKYMRAGYGEKIRGFLPTALTLSQAIDFGDLPVFTAAAYPAIVVGQKTSPLEGHSLRVADLAAPIRRYLTAQGKPVNRETVTAVMERLPMFLAESAVPAYPQVLLRKSGWILEDPALVRLFDRLMSQGTPLGKFVNGRMYAGIKTGLNDAFVIDEAKREALMKADPRSSEVIKPWLRGRDIKRWRVEPAGLYLIAIQNSADKDARNPWGSTSSETEARRIFRQTYPAIHDHLSKFEQYEVVDNQGRKKKVGLRLREDQGKWWWELRACKFYREFAEPKLVWKKTSFRPAFLTDSSGAYVSNTTHFITGANPWLVAAMNSTIMEFFMVLRINLLRGGYIELTPTRIDTLPMPNFSEKQKARLTELSEDARCGVTDVEDKVDVLVGQACLLRPHEIEAIQKYLAIRRSLGPEEESDEDIDNE
ncbi:MAG: Eco57I restriction-modification methylase domain-containing protein [Chloroflexi bacterium]|nr:Eco57I restriction-modification methylase domain-containing protein [Chloroflexota bacterium]